MAFAIEDGTQLRMLREDASLLLRSMSSNGVRAVRFDRYSVYSRRSQPALTSGVGGAAEVEFDAL